MKENLFFKIDEHTIFYKLFIRKDRQNLKCSPMISFSCCYSLHNKFVHGVRASFPF